MADKTKTIAFHMPYPDTVYAYRTVFTGFMGAFKDMGHNFVVFSPGDDLKEFLETNKPDVFITVSHFFYRKFLDFELLKKYREKTGMVLLTKIDFWSSPLSKGRINEAPSMKDDSDVKRLIKKGLLADEYFSTASKDDLRMDGFSKFSGKDYITIPLAADKLVLEPEYDESFAADISFIGTNLPQKRKFFKEWLFPLRKEYDLKLYGQDWNSKDKFVGFATKVGQYYNLPVLKSLQKPSLKLGDEAKIYASSKILVNIHEDYQRQYGGDCNERTFKIPFCGGLEITDEVEIINEYFVEDKEIVIAKNKDEWFEKIRYYYDNPSKAKKIAQAGRKRVLKDHTYHNRAQQIIDLIS